MRKHTITPSNIRNNHALEPLIIHNQAFIMRASLQSTFLQISSRSDRTKLRRQQMAGNWIHQGSPLHRLTYHVPPSVHKLIPMLWHIGIACNISSCALLTTPSNKSTVGCDRMSINVDMLSLLFLTSIQAHLSHLQTPSTWNCYSRLYWFYVALVHHHNIQFHDPVSL